jgi:glycosyltransferase involved in cell wall biosynthesis
MSNQSWSIIILCFNEVDTVKQVTLQACEVLRKMKIEDWEVIIIDDGSTDGSRECVENLQLENVRFVFHERNKGIGHTLHSGYATASKENVCVIPSDGEFDLNELLPYSAVEANQFISFYRLENTSYSLVRNYLSKLNKLVNTKLNGFSLLDVNWVKIYKNKDLQQLDLTIKSSLVESEICGKLLSLGREVIEVESKYLTRKFGKSKGASLKIVLQALSDIILVSSTLKRFRVKQQEKHKR